MWIQRARTAPPSIVVPAQAETSGVQRICDGTATPLGSRLRGNDVGYGERCASLWDTTLRSGGTTRAPTTSCSSLRSQRSR
jgi:hypothetical protein